MKTIPTINYEETKNKIEQLDADKKPIALGLLKEIMYMGKTLKKLKKDIDKKGVVVNMCQGSYSIDRTNPSLPTYNSTIKNFTSTSKQLFDMLPKNDSDDDDFDNDNLE